MNSGGAVSTSPRESFPPFKRQATPRPETHLLCASQPLTALPFLHLSLFQNLSTEGFGSKFSIPLVFWESFLLLLNLI